MTIEGGQQRVEGDPPVGPAKCCVVTLHAVVVSRHDIRMLAVFGDAGRRMPGPRPDTRGDRITQAELVSIESLDKLLVPGVFRRQQYDPRIARNPSQVVDPVRRQAKPAKEHKRGRIMQHDGPRRRQPECGLASRLVAGLKENIPPVECPARASREVSARTELTRPARRSFSAVSVMDRASGYHRDQSLNSEALKRGNTTKQPESARSISSGSYLSSFCSNAPCR